MREFNACCKPWKPTGNPFVDIGEEMMASLARVDRVEELTVEHIEPLLKRLVNIYFQQAWKKTLYSIFPNSPITNPATKNPRKNYLELLQNWLSLISQPGKSTIQETSCAACGGLAQLKLSRTLFPMVDFEGGNFQSFNEAGIPFCAACALAVQFMPLGITKVGGKLALPQFSNHRAQFDWCEWCWKQTLISEATEAAGPVDVGTTRSVNAFFALIEKLLRDMSDRDIPNSSITLYLFTNYNQGPDIELHYLPTEVFRFIKQAMSPTLQRNWRQVVNRGYMNNPQKYDPETLDESEQLKKRTNQVYENLLSENSISPYFVDIHQRRPVGDWELFKAYLKEVRGMDEQRLKSLKMLGERIAMIIRNKRKRLLSLERANYKGEFIEQLYRLSKDAVASGQDRPLLTFDELVQDVFPHDPEKYESWREIKYLLLFRIYDLLFEELKEDKEWATTNEEKEILQEVTE